MFFIVPFPFETFLLHEFYDYGLCYMWFQFFIKYFYASSVFMFQHFRKCISDKILCFVRILKLIEFLEGCVLLLQKMKFIDFMKR